MKVLAVLFIYMLFSGLLFGPTVGDWVRCGKKFEVSDMAATLMWPLLLGMAVTSGKLPDYKGCAK